MKTRVTKREIMSNFSEIMEVDYCVIQRLLNHFSAQYYTSGVYGWNADVYVIDEMVIVTGYRPFGTFIPDYKSISRVNKSYEKIYAKKLPYDKECKQVKKLLKSLYKKP